MLLIYCQYLFNINGNNVVEEYHLKEIRSWLLCSDWMLSFLFGRITKPLRRNVKRFIFVSFHDDIRLVELFSIRFICTQWNLHARHRKFGLITSACFIPGCFSALWEALILRQLNSLSVSRFTFSCYMWTTKFGGFTEKTLKHIMLLLTWWVRNAKYCLFF